MQRIAVSAAGPSSRVGIRPLRRWCIRRSPRPWLRLPRCPSPLVRAARQRRRRRRVGDFELIAEPANPHDPWAVSVRADGHRVGYLPRDDAPNWAPAVRRVMASGLVPVVPGRMYAFLPREDWDWDGDRNDLGSTIQLNMGDPAEALPINDPPLGNYTLLPRSSWVQVTKESEHSAALLPHVPASGHGVLFATLHEVPLSRPVVEVRIDGERIGQLTAPMSQRYLPLIQHLADRSLITACRAEINGSSLAAEVRISAVKANEAGPEILHGPAVVIPHLAPTLSDPAHYDVGATEWFAEDKQRKPSTSRSALPPPGWHPDPQDPALIRYWNGTAWTEHTASWTGQRWV